MATTVAAADVKKEIIAMIKNKNEAMAQNSIYKNIIASSSSGNCVVFNNVMIDCGVSFKKIVENQDLREIDVLCITHHHTDHFKFSTLKKIIETNPKIKIVCGNTISLFLRISKINHVLLGIGETYENTDLGVTIRAIKLYHMNSFTQNKDQIGFIKTRVEKGSMDLVENILTVSELAGELGKRVCENYGYDIVFTGSKTANGAISFYEKTLFQGTDTNGWMGIKLPDRDYYALECNYEDYTLDYSKACTSILNKIERRINEDETYDHTGRTRFVHCSKEDTYNFFTMMKKPGSELIELHKSSSVYSMADFKKTDIYLKAKSYISTYLGLNIEEIDLINYDFKEELQKLKEE